MQQWRAKDSSLVKKQEQRRLPAAPSAGCAHASSIFTLSPDVMISECPALGVSTFETFGIVGR
jgi:hypothetical protein